MQYKSVISSERLVMAVFIISRVRGVGDCSLERLECLTLSKRGNRPKNLSNTILDHSE